MVISKNQLTPKEGQALVNEFHASKLKGSIFCRQKNISYHILQYWRDRCSVMASKKVSSNAKFLPVTIPPQVTNDNQRAKIKITVNAKTVIELPIHIDAGQLSKILKACIACG